MLDRLAPRPGARRPPKRVGRGPGSGVGKTSGRGIKGQGKRSAGRETSIHFEGGQMPLVRRVPKRGFHNPGRTLVQVVNLGALAVFEKGAVVDVEALHRRGLIRTLRHPVKLLAEGEAPASLTVKVHRASAAARKKIEAGGGSVEIIS